MRKLKLLAGAAILAASAFSTAYADQVILDDLIIQFSACVGQDCVNGESFGFDTFRLKENNLRIHFQDTSNSASFPSNDWRIIANDSSNGGANYLAIEDSDAGRIPFRIEAGARANALYVEADSDVGIGTANPVVDLHMVTGNTPTLRLEQDGTSGFTPQVYDIAANEANFFIRDVTNGSALFFRAQPGAPADSMYIANDGDIGMGTSSPGGALHVRRTNGTAQLKVEEANASPSPRVMAQLSNNGTTILQLMETSGGSDLAWNIQNRSAAEGNEFRIVNAVGSGEEFRLSTDGDLIITGDLTTGGSGACAVGCDRVFSEDYELLSLDEHNSLMWAHGYLPNVGPTPEDGPFNVSVKVGRMLNELEHAHIYIGQLNERVAVLEARLEE